MVVPNSTWARSPLAGLVVLASMLLSGCSAAGGHATTTTDPLQEAAVAIAVQATPTTGVVRGVVVDDGIRPLAGVSLVLRGAGAANTTSNSAGAFGFQGLPPGSYLLRAARGGYLPAQVGVTVRAGDSAPDIVKVQLATNRSFVPPYVQVQKSRGFIECTTSKLAPCQATNTCLAVLGCNNLTDDRSVFRLQIDPGPAFVQSEWVWEAASDSNQRIRFQMSSDDAARPGCAGKWVNQTGDAVSPSYATVEGALVGPLKEGSSTCAVKYSVQAGALAEPTCLDPDPDNGFMCPGLTFQQDFTVFLHAFYGYHPPAGWRFSQDGDADPPR
ncbi:MAG TPA: carboxypeptidase-like regulatory domain-containing protein [Candidatus Thermoplasmatota archaeon]|nr:carboxypeptidase-like regulatory domain-containing protein [Candidatus Thermoplasmatota archaeon]